MQPFTVLQGRAVPLLQPNIDTDMIVRIERLTGVPRESLGPYALESMRFRPDGSEDPDFVLNQPVFRDAPILLTGPNFGCGSSREGAVWALAGRGVRCVIGPSFGDIFNANCFQNGLLPVKLDAAACQRVLPHAAAGESITVDLVAQHIVLPGGDTIGFKVDPMQRTAMLEGQDEITRTLSKDAAIRTWQAQDKLARPWVW